MYNLEAIFFANNVDISNDIAKTYWSKLVIARPILFFYQDIIQENRKVFYWHTHFYMFYYVHYYLYWRNDTGLEQWLLHVRFIDSRRKLNCYKSITMEK